MTITHLLVADRDAVRRGRGRPGHARLGEPRVRDLDVLGVHVDPDQAHVQVVRPGRDGERLGHPDQVDPARVRAGGGEGHHLDVRAARPPERARHRGRDGALGGHLVPEPVAEEGEVRAEVADPDDRGYLYELIQLSRDGLQKVRTWHWMSGDRLVKRTVINESRVA
ncbi:hypothetical protein [Actinomadura xylanilytica]|uniref:hypothetical protein n=1 Tax=Actinomadura xylanilytica TaxID=887459 RepID=UPI00255AE1B6|nr:hypothetical protein [Actinomadura xylanilytica]MDL4772536.1 hypothetical protein [Actinomadura xylanilytica]